MSNKIPGVITTKEAAAILAVDRRQVANILAQAGIHAQSVGKAYAWPEAAVKQFAMKQAAAARRRIIGGRV